MQSLNKFIAFIKSQDGIGNKAKLISLAVEEFNLIKDRSAYYCNSFAVRFSQSSGGGFSNTVLSLSKHQKYDNLPINEYCRFVDHPKETRWKSYEVCGKQLQESMAISYAREIVQKTYDRYGDRARLAQANEGIDWKAVSHAFRAGYQLLEIYRTGDLKYPLKSALFLKSVKLGEKHYINDGIQEMLDTMLHEVEEESAKSSLPEKVDQKWIEQFILEQYQERTSCAQRQKAKE